MSTGRQTMAAALLAAVVIRLALNAAVLAANPLPVGDDGYWHLARPLNIARTGWVPDGTLPDPVESRFYEYPVPYHLLLLVLSWTSGLGMLPIFRLLHLVQPLAHILLVYALLRPSLGMRYASMGALMAAGTVSTGSYHGLLFAYPSTLSLLLLLASVLLLRHGRTVSATVVLVAGMLTHLSVVAMAPVVYLLLCLDATERRRAGTVVVTAGLVFLLLWFVPTFAMQGHLPKRGVLLNAASMVPGMSPVLERWFPAPAPEVVDVAAVRQKEAVSYPKGKFLLFLNPVLMVLALLSRPMDDPLRLAWLPTVLLFVLGFPASYRLLLFAAQLLPLAAAPGLARVLAHPLPRDGTVVLLVLVLLSGPAMETHLAISWRQVYAPVDLVDAVVLREHLGDADVTTSDPLVYAVLALTGERPPYRVERHGCDPPTELFVLHLPTLRRCPAPAAGWTEIERLGGYVVYRRAAAG